MNYAELTAAVEDYCENTFTAGQLAIFVQNAESRIYNQVQLPAIRKNVTGALTISNKYLSCPTDFLSVFSIAVQDPTTLEYSYLLNKDVNFIREAYPLSTTTGIPKYYALFGPSSSDATELTFILGPTPDLAYLVELHYFFYPTSIVSTSTTWLGDNFESVLLYGALLEAYTFMKGEADVMAGYKGRYDEALALLKRLGDGLERQDAYRSGQARIQVP